MASADSIFSSSSSSASFPNFAAFTSGSDGASAGMSPEKEVPVNTSAEMMPSLPISAWDGEGQTDRGTPEKAESTSAGCTPDEASATESAASSGAPEGAVTTPERPTTVSSWSAFREGADRRHSAELPTPTNSEVSSITTPMTTSGNLLSWSAFGDDVTAAAAAGAAATATIGGDISPEFVGSGQNAYVARGESNVSGKQLFGSSSSSGPLESEGASIEGCAGRWEGEEKSEEAVPIDDVAVTASAAVSQATGSLGENDQGVKEEGNGSVEEGNSPVLPRLLPRPASIAGGSHTAAAVAAVAAAAAAAEKNTSAEVIEEKTTGEEMAETSTAEHGYRSADLEAAGDDNGSVESLAGAEDQPDEEGQGNHETRSSDLPDPPRCATPTKTEVLRGIWRWRKISSRRSKGRKLEKEEGFDSTEVKEPSQTSAEALKAASIATAVLDAAKPADATASERETVGFGDLQSAPGSVVVPEVSDRILTVRVEVGAVVLAGPEAVLSSAEAAAAHARSPLLGSNGRFTSVPSSKGEMETVAVTDLWNGGDTTW